MKKPNKNPPAERQFQQEGQKQITKIIISEKGGKFNERIKRQ